MPLCLVCAAPEVLLMSLVCAAAESYDAVRGSCCGRGPSRCPRSALPPETAWMSVVHAIARSHAEVREWRVLWLTVKGKEASFHFLKQSLMCSRLTLNSLYRQSWS